MAKGSKNDNDADDRKKTKSLKSKGIVKGAAKTKARKGNKV